MNDATSKPSLYDIPPDHLPQPTAGSPARSGRGSARSLQRKGHRSHTPCWQLHRLTRLDRVLLRSRTGPTGKPSIASVYSHLAHGIHLRLPRRRSFRSLLLQRGESQLSRQRKTPPTPKASELLNLPFDSTSARQLHPANHSCHSFQIAFWKFDEKGAVLKYDAWITNLNTWIEASSKHR
jgi:hypothetical protein